MVLYADRSRLYVGGTELLDLQSVTVNLNDGAKLVNTMTSDRRNRGWVRSNRDITINCELAVQSSNASAKLEAIDWDTQDVSMLFEQGADKYLLKGVCLTTMSAASSGVGAESKRSLAFLALDMVDLVGNSVLFTTSLANFT